MLRAVTSFRLALTACLLLPLLAHAAGLGRLTVQSALGQPLRAEVEVVSLQPGEADGLNARIASPEAFRMAGIEFQPVLLSIRVAIEQRSGRPVLRLTSTQPINEPFVELLLELQWGTGRLVREYTFLLDPVEYKPPQPVAAVPPPAAAPAVAKPAPAAPPVAAKPAVSVPKAAGTYQVKRGDTLSKVARETRPANVSVNQMLVALYQANPNAFMRNNMYLMRSGHILNVPDQAVAAAVSPAEATRLVRSQGAEFDEYRRGLGAAVAAAPAKPAPKPERDAPGRIAPKPAAEPARREAKDQIKLSRADSSKPAAQVSRAATDDDKASLNRALKESQSRVADLEKQVTDLQKLIELKNQQLAVLEQKAAKPAAEAPKPVPAAPKPAPEPAQPAAEAPKPAASTPQAEAPKPAPPAPKPKAVAPPPPPPPSLMDEFTENPLALAGLGGVLALLIGYGVWAWRRKKASQSQEGGFSSIAAASVAAATAREPDPAVAAAIAAAEPHAAAASAEEVDPIAEAEVYLAYGRDAQAETILKDAVASNPDRLAAHAKLLDIYAQRRDAAEFEKAALKVKSLTGGVGPEWEKAMSLGRSVDPDNGLYGKGPAASAEPPAPVQAAAASPSVDFDIGATTQGDQAPAAFKPGDTVILSATDMQAASANMDFDIGAITGETQAAPPSPPPEAAAASKPAAASSGLDFDLDFDLGEAKPAAPAASTVDPKWQEVATKLDLAKAYVEMGDKDGARELVNEVLKDGDAAQLEEAKRLLAKLA